MGRPKGNTVKKPKRPEIPDKEHLIQYLEANSSTEYPFVEEVWEQAVAKAKENEGKQNPVKKIITTDKNGNEVVENKVAGTLVTDPVKYYFRLMGLQQNKKKGIALQEAKIEENQDKQEILNVYFGDTQDNVYLDEITSWIAMFSPDERDYLKKRYASYYDQYEINEGADKVSLKRILSLEIEFYRIDKRRAAGKTVDYAVEEKLTKQFNSILESLKWTKKQRNAREDMAQNKFTVWMDNLVKEGKFNPNPKHYPKDEIDFLMETYIDAIREMLT